MTLLLSARSDDAAVCVTQHVQAGTGRADDGGGVRCGRRRDRNGAEPRDGERFLQRPAGPLDAAPGGGASETVRIAPDERNDLEAAACPEAGNLDACAESRADDDDAYLLHAHGHVDPKSATSTMRPV